MPRFKTVESNIIQVLKPDYTEIYVERRSYLAGGTFELPLKESDEETLKKIGEFGASIIRRLAKVSGITKIVVYKENAVRLFKDEALSWVEDRISAEVKRAICEFDVCEER